jgi:hypothetical protein
MLLATELAISDDENAGAPSAALSHRAAAIPGLLRCLTNPHLGPSLHGIPGTAEWWRIGEIEVTHLVNTHFMEDRYRCNVDALGHLSVAMPKELNPQEAACRSVSGVAHRDAMAAGVVRLVVVRNVVDRDWVEPSG